MTVTKSSCVKCTTWISVRASYDRPVLFHSLLYQVSSCSVKTLFFSHADTDQVGEPSSRSHHTPSLENITGRQDRGYRIKMLAALRLVSLFCLMCTCHLFPDAGCNGRASLVAVSGSGLVYARPRVECLSAPYEKLPSYLSASCNNCVLVQTGFMCAPQSSLPFSLGTQ